MSKSADRLLPPVASPHGKDKHMLTGSKAFSGFSTDDISATRRFYEETLGIRVSEANGMLTLHLAGGRDTLVYPKSNHVPAEYTTLNFPVSDIEATVRELAAKGVVFDKGPDIDDLGVHRGGGPLIAWFSDPAGNILSVIQES
jgi:catechol 2,3-dioxygenase-like lactoylglutathione lyase family enzyme